MAKLCQWCSKANLKRSNFTKPCLEYQEAEDDDERIFLSGVIGDLKVSRSTCDFCNLIWLAMEKHDAEELATVDNDTSWSLRWVRNTNDFVTDEDDPDYDEEIDLKFCSGLSPCFGSSSDGLYAIQLIDEPQTNDFLRGRLVSPGINIDMVKGWLKRCKDLHGEDCAAKMLETRPLSATSIASFMVIDVIDSCLLPMPAGAEYTALSYVWGETNRPVTLKSNRSAFAKPGGLHIQLPQTIADAIAVTAALGLRYLWVDSLCIVQDEFETKMQNINSMDAIYSNSALTIVAATGSGAHSGLSGWSSQQGRDQHQVQLAEDCRIGILPYYQHELLASEHASRAWTYQETCLSPRCLIFLNGFVYFNCNAAVYAEFINAEITGISPEASANTLGKTDDAESKLQRFGSHVITYTGRNLKFQSDSVNAFAGVAEAVSRPMGVDSLLFGVPASCFDWALLWQGAESLSRRYNLPSWSWIGWKGRISMPMDSGAIYTHAWLLQATWIDWYAVEHDGSCTILWNSARDNNAVSPITKSVIIADTLESHNEDIQDDDELSTDEEEDEHCPTYGLSEAGNLFGRQTHPSARELIPSPAQALAVYEKCIDVKPGTLCFAAPAIILSASPPTGPGPAYRDLPYNLLDSQGKACGSLSTCNNSAWPTDHDVQVKLLLVSSLYEGVLSPYAFSDEVAAILEAYVGSNDHIRDYIDHPPHLLDWFDFVNVLCVQETNDIVELHKGGTHLSTCVYERTGVGIIHREALRTCQIGWEDIVLG